jgi:hypothetical protein
LQHWNLYGSRFGRIEVRGFNGSSDPSRDHAADGPDVSQRGLVLGFIVCVLIHLLTGRAKEIKPAAYALAGRFLLHYLRL